MAEVSRMLADPRIQGPVYDRLRWKTEDFYTDTGAVALCKAIQDKNITEIDRLIKSGVDVNVKGTGNMTPLLWAFPAGEEVFAHLLELGADPNVLLSKDILGGFNKGTSVTMACAAGQIDGELHEKCFYDVNMDRYLELVLKHGGDPNQENSYGETPIFWILCSAPHQNSYDKNRQLMSKKIRLLLAAGADLNHKSEGDTVLCRMIGRNYCGPLILLKAGADYRIPDRFGWDPVVRLAYEKREEEKRSGARTPEPAKKEIFDWLAAEGVNWEAAFSAIESGVLKTIKSLPADYRHRPWLPQRPTLKNPKSDDDNRRK